MLIRSALGTTIGLSAQQIPNTHLTPHKRPYTHSEWRTPLEKLETAKGEKARWQMDTRRQTWKI